MTKWHVPERDKDSGWDEWNYYDNIMSWIGSLLENKQIDISNEEKKMQKKKIIMIINK